MDAGAKAVLKDYLHGARETLVWKTDGLSERDLRLPRTPTGTNLLGLVKHAGFTESLYFGTVFGRPWPTPEDFASPDDDDEMADMYATRHESVSSVVDLYRRVQIFADETIDSNPLEARGVVAHWGDAGVTLHHVLVHTIVDLQRHAGQADILRESIDGSTGLLREHSNLPDDVDWSEHTRRLTAIADGAAAGSLPLSRPEDGQTDRKVSQPRGADPRNPEKVSPRTLDLPVHLEAVMGAG